MRARLTAGVSLLVLLALSGAGVVVYTIQLQRLEAASARAVEQELAELSALQDQGVNPETGEPFEDAAQMITLFLSRNVPASDEVLVGWWDGAPRIRSPADDLTSRGEFRELVSALVPEGGSRRTEVPGRGEVLVTVQSVRTGDQDGALVVVTLLDRTRSGLYTTMGTYALVSLAALLVVTGVAAWQSGRLLAPLRLLRETAEEITGSDLSRRVPETGNDDITALSRTANDMLDRLQSAFAAQRQFLDDAGHELRTPLTVLRGHLELMDADDPEDVATTRALLLDEVDRMGRLVEDLTLLTKSRRPDFLHPEPVHLGQLTRTLLAKARGMGERRWVLDAVAEVTVRIDEQRITQAVLQLVDNAVKHTDPGDEVALGSAADGSVRLWVRDSGAGVPVEDREHVFERFGRSRVRSGDEGFGLGLSIVRAVVQAHGGTVTVDDAADGGALFVVRLPGERLDPWPGS